MADNNIATPHAGTRTMTLRVADMSCGHCAATITRAIETAIPGARVDADPVSKIVSVRGAHDVEAVKALVAGAGYTPLTA